MKGPLRRIPFRRRTADPVGQEAQPTAVTAPEAAPSAPAERPPADVATEDVAPSRPGFRDRGRLRRRMRYLRRVRELGFRDLGGLVFDLHRFGRRNDDLVVGKLAALEAVDRELRAIERVLDERRDIIELREPGVAACPHCGALHGSDARFCPQCGMQFSGPLAIGEVGGAPTPPEALPATATPVSGPLAGNAPVEPAANADATAGRQPRNGGPHDPDQPTQAMPAVDETEHAAQSPAMTSGDPLAGREPHQP